MALRRTSFVVLAVGAATVLAGAVPAQATPTIGRVTVDYLTAGDSNNTSTRAQISPDGGFLCFESTATDLVANDDHTAGSDIFWADLATGQIQRVSVDATTGGDSNGSSIWCSISTDGTYVTFNSTSTDLVDGMTTFGDQVFERDMATGITSLVSWSDVNGKPANGYNIRSSVSANGQYVTFNSSGTNLVAGATHSGDVYVRDLATATTQLVTQAWDGGPANGTSLHPVISDDGTHVAYESHATNLIPDDTSTVTQLFETDLATGATVLVTPDDVTGLPDNGRSARPSISGDGQFVAFESTATDLVPTAVPGGSATEIYVRDTIDNVTTLVSLSDTDAPLPSASSRASIDSDGTIVAFESTAHDVVAHMPVLRRQVYVRDLTSGTNQLVSVADTGGAGASCPTTAGTRAAPNGNPAPSDIATRATIDAAGDAIGFVSNYCNLVATPTQTPPHLDVYLWRAG